jgi:G:T-mismatch repair DNA endonuclease (very short patch repair protein)
MNNIGKWNNSNTAEFIEKAIKIHGNMYNYTKVIYTKAIENVIIICKNHGDFEISPNSHLNGNGCSKCYSKYSKKQIQWLECISKIKGIQIQHAMNENEYTIPTTNFKADGFCKETNTIYEFHGDFWHGNPKLYNSQDMNAVNKKTFGELYQQTIARETQLKELGYNLVVLWEYDWNKAIKTIRYLQKQFRYLKHINNS